MEWFVQLHKKIMDWEWYTDIPTKVLFFHILLKCNYKEARWKGKIVKPWDFITSIEHLTIETGLSRQQVRTAIEKLKKTWEITHYSTNEYTTLTLNNWEAYNTPDNKRTTNEQQTNNKRITTTNKNNKENKEKKEIYISDFSNNFQEIYESWLIDRKQRKKPVTEKAKELQLNRCREWGEEKSITIIKKAIEKSWQWLEDYDNKDDTKKTPSLADSTKKSIEREKQANEDKKKEIDIANRKKREDEIILEWLATLDNSRKTNIEQEILQSPLITWIKRPDDKDAPPEVERKNNMIRRAERDARIYVARKYYFESH